MDGVPPTSTKKRSPLPLRFLNARLEQVVGQIKENAQFECSLILKTCSKFDAILLLWLLGYAVAQHAQEK